MKSATLLCVFIMIVAHATLGAVKFDFVVAQDGSGNFTTVQAAIDASQAFPSAPVCIFVKNGTYREKVLVPSCNTHLRIVGESVDKTVITYDDHFKKINRGRNSTFYTYTFCVEASDFTIENITIENSAGPVGQAVALHVIGDRCVVRNCRIVGNQDTIYAAGEASRQYYVDSYIEGTTDFIFGEATAFFEHCTLRIKANSFITAASTTKGKRFGYVFEHCTLTAPDSVTKAYLGRPWRDHARVVFMHCDIGAFIDGAGWMNWENTRRDTSAYYAEYDNTGSGASLARRVPWSKVLTANEVKAYARAVVLHGSDGWNP